VTVRRVPAALRCIFLHLSDIELDEKGLADRASLLIWGREKIPMGRRVPAVLAA
jgi:hypothetical protein